MGNIRFDLNGKTDLDWGGHVMCDDLVYFRGMDSLKTSHLDIGVFSEEEMYRYTLESTFFDAQISGNFEWDALVSNFYNDLAVILPSIKVGKENEILSSYERIDHTVEFNIIGKSSDHLLNFFVPGLYVDSSSKIVGKYNAFSRDLARNKGVGLYNL